MITGSFLTPLEVEPLSSGRFWEVKSPFIYRVGFAKSPVYVEVPVGFITDFASIPKPFWSITPPFGFYSKPSCIHDKLYKDGVVQVDGLPDRAITQLEADSIFDQAMRISAAYDVDVRACAKGFKRYSLIILHWITRNIIYQGVRNFGHTTWNKYRANDMVALESLEQEAKSLATTKPVVIVEVKPNVGSTSAP